MRFAKCLKGGCVGCHLGCHDAQIWRGWMGIEPTQDGSAAPRKQFLKTAGSAPSTVYRCAPYLEWGRLRFRDRQPLSTIVRLLPVIFHLIDTVASSLT